MAVMALLFLAGCQTVSRDGAEAERSGGRELVDLDHRIVAYAERAGDREPYRPPSRERRERLAGGVARLLAGDRAGAERLLGDAGFRVTRLTDTASGRRYDEVAAAQEGAEARWGRLYLHADAPVRWSVQVPHPVADRGTERLGARLLESTPGGALVLAGAHRTAGRDDAADVAHRTDSVFHAIVLQLQKRGIPGVQLHGFARDSDRPFDAIVSTGAAEAEIDEASVLAELMENAGMRVCRGWADRCPLEGTTNVQGKAARRNGAAFVHVELSPKARADDGRQAERARGALAGLLNRWSETGAKG